MNQAEMLAKIAELESANAKLTAQTVSNTRLSLRVSVKGAVSVYGLGRFPVTLYEPQMIRLLAAGEEIKAFMTANREGLSKEKPTTKTVAAQPLKLAQS